MNPWFVARASGLTAYAVLSASAIAGLLLSSKFLGKRASKPLTIAHEAGSIGGLLLIGLHMWAVLNDTFFKFTWRALVIPGASPYAPLAVSLGVIGMWIALVVVGSFYVRKKIGPRTWRRLHYLTFGLFVLMTLHGVRAGTDGTNPAVTALYAGSTGTLLVMVGQRIRSSIHKSAERKRRRAAIAQRKAETAGDAPAVAELEPI